MPICRPDHASCGLSGAGVPQAPSGLVYVQSGVDQLAGAEKPEVQDASVPDGIEFTAAIDKGSRRLQLTSVTCCVVRGLVDDAVAAFKIAVVANYDFVLLRNTFAGDLPSREDPPLADRSDDALIGKGELDVAATAWNRCHVHHARGRPHERIVVRHLLAPERPPVGRSGRLTRSVARHQPALDAM